MKITLIKTNSPKIVSKVFERMDDGSIVKRSVASIYDGTAKQRTLSGAKDLVALLKMVTARTDIAIVPGIWRDAEDGIPFSIVKETDLKRILGADVAPGGVIRHNDKLIAARLKCGIDYSELVLLDADNPPGMPPEWAALSIGARLSLWEEIVPGISRCERVELRGSSARVINGSDTHQRTHAWIRVSHPQKIALLKLHINIHMVNKGLSFKFAKHSRKTPENIVALEDRGLFDLAVFDAGRLVFCSAPMLINMPDYTVRDADIAIVNEGAGPLDISWLTDVRPSAISEYKKKVGHDVKISGGGMSVEVVGQLTLDTEIESRGDVKLLREWISTMKPGDKLRCEAPFRESKSEAAMIRITDSGEPIVHDVGNGTTYRIRKTSAIGSDINRRLSKITGAVVDVADHDAAIKIENSIAYVVRGDRFLMLSDSGALVECSFRELGEFMARSFDAIVAPDAMNKIIADATIGMTDTKADKTAAALRAIPLSCVASHVRYYNQRTVINYRVDMFAERDHMAFDFDSVSIIYRHKPFLALPYDKDLAEDWCDHFGMDGEFDDFLEWLAACRFASNRKRSYVWLQASSDFGKSFMAKIFETHGIVTELSTREVERIFEGNPTGLMPADFLYSWITLIDEFKSTKSELKQLQQSMMISPKFQMVSRVELYAKIFMSAEDVSSLAGEESGVEDQFANRMNYMNKTGVLNDREKFLNSSIRYFDAVKNYVGERLNALVDRYCKMGRQDSADAADAFLNDFYDQHGIDKSFTRMSEKMDEVVDDLLSNMRSVATRMLEENTERIRWNAQDAILADSLVAEIGRDHFYLRRPARTISDWISLNYSRSEGAKIAWKGAKIAKLIGVYKVFRIGNKTIKAIEISF